MKVAVLGAYPRDKNKIVGGTSAVAWRLADALSRVPDIEVHTVTLSSDVTGVEYQVCRKVHEHYIPASDNFNSLTFYAANRKRMQPVIREIDPDVIHIHGTMHYPPCIWNMGIPWVITPHGLKAKEAVMYPGLRAKLRAPLSIWYERWLYKVAKDIILCNGYILPFVEPYTKARFYEVGNALDDVADIILYAADFAFYVQTQIDRESHKPQDCGCTELQLSA